MAYRAAALGKNDAIALSSAGFALSIAAGKADEAVALIERALATNPNLVLAWYSSGWTRVFLGEADMAIEHFRHAMRLSPLDPLLYLPQSGLALAYFLLGRYDDASSWAENALRENPTVQIALRAFAASNALAGRLGDAQNEMAQLRQIDPSLRVSDLTDRFPFWPSGAHDKYLEGLRKAGLPE